MNKNPSMNNSLTKVHLDQKFGFQCNPARLFGGTRTLRAILIQVESGLCKYFRLKFWVQRVQKLKRVPKFKSPNELAEALEAFDRSNKVICLMTNMLWRAQCGRLLGNFRCKIQTFDVREQQKNLADTSDDRLAIWKHFEPIWVHIMNQYLWKTNKSQIVW